MISLLIGPVSQPFVQPCAAQPAAAEVVARVDGAPILALDVERLVHESVKNRALTDESRAELAKAALEQLVGRQLILARLRRDGAGPDADEVARALRSLETRAEQNKQPFSDWLSENRFTLETLRDEVTWRIAWRRYLQTHVTDAALAQYFQKHRRHFDGSQVRVAQILFKPATPGASAHQAAAKHAQQVREEIVAGKLSFSQAAQKHSAAPSADTGGELGFIPRHGVMDESFSLAAFELEQGQIGSPVTTPFGVHLIHCLEIRPGKKTFNDCREALRVAVAQELFDRLAADERRTAKIEYMPRAPKP